MTVSYYMACLDLRGRECLVVGGGRVATEKVRGLLAAGASVTVVAPDVDGRFLVIAATNRRAVNAAVSEAAAELSTLCNVADDPELCSFILPAVTRHDPIVVAVSSGGASPALAKRIRDDIARLIGPEHADLARELASLRPWAKRALPTYEARRDYFERLVAEALL